jgi:hypothetical protein
VELPPSLGIATGAYDVERDDWDAAVARATAEGWRLVELTAIYWDRLEKLAPFLERKAQELETFERVSLHAPLTGPEANAARVVDRLAAMRWQPETVFHPDHYRDERSLDRLGSRVVFENMDVQKAFGRNADDLATVFATFPEAGFCLDVAHVWTNDPTLALGHDLLDAFGGRLRQLHVSGIEPDGTHRPTTPGDLALYRPLLDRCGGVPWILEAVLA